MKIELNPVPVEKDTGAKTPKHESARSAQGDAFDRAVRGVAPNGRAKERDDKTKAPTENEETAALEEAADKPVLEADPAAPLQSEPKDLRSLLGLLGASSAIGAQGAAEPDDALSGIPADRNLVDVAAMVLDAEAAEGAVALSGVAKAAAEQEPATAKGLRLEVVRMETHFEPRQDGMVLVETSGQKDAGAKVLADGLRALANAPVGPLGAKSGIADGTRTAKTDPSAEASDSSATGEAVRVSFDEALARLGRHGTSGRGAGEGASRDGSASSQSAISDLNGRRAEARGLDAANSTAASSTGSDAVGLASQVAGRIVDALGDRTSSAEPTFTAPGETHLRMRAGGAALKTLTIQLQPEHLGTLDVAMRLSEGKLTLEISASQGDTAALLTEDRGTLRKLLEHAGFALDEAAITVITKDAQAPTAKSSEGAGGGATRENNPGGSQGGGGGDRASAGSSGRESDPRQQRSVRAEQPELGDRRLVSTYL